MFVDEEDDYDNPDTKLYGYLQLRIATISLQEAIVDYMQKLRTFNLDFGDDGHFILESRSRMLRLADRICDRADVIEECIDKEIKYARQALDLAKQVLRHCHSGPFNRHQPSPDMVEDLGLKRLFLEMRCAIVEYNEKLAASSLDVEFHEQIRELDTQASTMVEIAIDKYDEVMHARKICEREKKYAREMMEYAKRALTDIHGERA
jgi:hypothetical protein